MFEGMKANKRIKQAIIAESEAVIASDGSGANQRYHAEAAKDLAEASEALNKERSETKKTILTALGTFAGTCAVIYAACKMDSQGEIPVGNIGKLFNKLHIN